MEKNNYFLGWLLSVIIPFVLIVICPSLYFILIIVVVIGIYVVGFKRGDSPEEPHGNPGDIGGKSY